MKWPGIGSPSVVVASGPAQEELVSGKVTAMPGTNPTAAPSNAPTSPIAPAYDAATSLRVRGSAPTAPMVAKSGRASESARNVAVRVPPSTSTAPIATRTRSTIRESSR